MFDQQNGEFCGTPVQQRRFKSEASRNCRTNETRKPRLKRLANNQYHDGRSTNYRTKTAMEGEQNEGYQKRFNYGSSNDKSFGRRDVSTNNGQPKAANDQVQNIDEEYWSDSSTDWSSPPKQPVTSPSGTPTANRNQTGGTSSLTNDHQSRVGAFQMNSSGPTLTISVNSENKRECYQQFNDVDARDQPKQQRENKDRRFNGNGRHKRGLEYSPSHSNRRLEVCKYYLNGHCFKKDQCLYMHSDLTINSFSRVDNENGDEQRVRLVREAQRGVFQESNKSSVVSSPSSKRKPEHFNFHNQNQSASSYNQIQTMTNTSVISPTRFESSKSNGFDLQEALSSLASERGQVLLSTLPNFNLAKAQSRSKESLSCSNSDASNMSSPSSATSPTTNPIQNPINFKSLAELLAFTSHTSSTQRPSEPVSSMAHSSTMPKSLFDLLGIYH